MDHPHNEVNTNPISDVSYQRKILEYEFNEEIKGLPHVTNIEDSTLEKFTDEIKLYKKYNYLDNANEHFVFTFYIMKSHIIYNIRFDETNKNCMRSIDPIIMSLTFINN